MGIMGLGAFPLASVYHLTPDLAESAAARWGERASLTQHTHHDPRVPVTGHADKCREALAF